jgi:hypothetical protein
MKTPNTTTLLFVLFAVGNASAGTVTLFNNFGPGNTYLPDSGYDIGPSATLAVAQSFTPSVNSTLTSLILGVSQASPGSDGIVISLQTDSGANSPSGTILESFSASGLPIFGIASSLTTENSVLHPFLSAGTTYWLEVSPNSANTTAFWNFPFDFDFGTTWAPSTGTCLSCVRSAMSVTADTVPEPESIGMFTLGAMALFGLGIVKRHRSIL